MATEKLNLSDLKKMIISEAEKIISLGDPLNVDMNKMTHPGNSTGDALVKSKETGGFVKKSSAPSAAKNIDDTEEPLEVDMNEMDGDQGHDEQIAAAVKVDAASSAKKGASVEGMKNSNFESKDKNPSTASSAPFEEREEKVEMNSQDKATDDGAKTYVEAGAELSKGASTGQHKANFSEKAKNERETAEIIAKAIQLPESFKNKAELLSFINEEAKKVSMLLEKMSYDEFEQMIKSFLDLAKSKGWVWNSSGNGSWYSMSSPAIALYHKDVLPTTKDGEYKGQPTELSKDPVANRSMNVSGPLESKSADVIMTPDYDMSQAYFYSKDKTILDNIKNILASYTDIIQDIKETSSTFTSAKAFEPQKYYYMLLRKKQG
jgi:hypothetical protein